MGLRLKRENGFTLIELMVVVLIIGILASAIIPETQSAKQGAKKTALAGDIDGIITGILTWKGNNPQKNFSEITSGELHKETGLKDLCSGSVNKTGGAWVCGSLATSGPYQNIYDVYGGPDEGLPKNVVIIRMTPVTQDAATFVEGRFKTYFHQDPTFTPSTTSGDQTFGELKFYLTI